MLEVCYIGFSFHISPNVRGMIKNYMDFPHYLKTDQTNVSKILLMIHGLVRNRCGKFGQLKLMHSKLVVVLLNLHSLSRHFCTAISHYICV